MGVSSAPRRLPSSLIDVETEAPAGFLQQGLRLTNLLVYLAQQWPIQQQLPPLSQQSAEREVAFAVPISAMAARIANRYFIKSSC